MICVNSGTTKILIQSREFYPWIIRLFSGKKYRRSVLYALIPTQKTHQILSDKSGLYADKVQTIELQRVDK